MKLTKDEKRIILLLLLGREGELHRGAFGYRQKGETAIADNMQREHDEVMALARKFQPRQQNSPDGFPPEE